MILKRSNKEQASKTLLEQLKTRLRVLSLLTQTVKNTPKMQETWVRYLCQENPLEKGMATHSSMLAWRIPWTENGVLQSTGYKDLVL